MLLTFVGLGTLLWTAAALSEEVNQPDPSSTAAVSQQERPCNALAGDDFSTILDAPTQITEAKWIKAEKSTPPFCMVKGYVAPNVGIQLGLPVSWNGKFMEVGCGGTCGILEAAFEGCDAILSKGYACIVTDAGHTGAWIDGLWGAGNLQAKLDWGYRAPHVTALAGKAITESYYQSSPRKSYFIGVSNGGRQALLEVQRFPWDFDGIVSIAPAADISTGSITSAWIVRALHDAAGKPLLGSPELKLVTDAVVAKCDLDDGVKDNVIGDPLHCPFDPSELICRGARTSGCLTPIQESAIRNVYAGPITSTGVRLGPGGPLVGSEFNGDTGESWHNLYLGQDDQLGFLEGLATQVIRYLMFVPYPEPTWTLRDFDFDRDPKRLQTMGALFDATNPDLRKFKAAGGKLLVLQGLNDAAVPPRGTIDYYESVERAMGGAVPTRNFARLFLLPGVNHGGAGDVGAGTLDYLSALEDWVEKGKSPNRLIAARLKDPEAGAWTLKFPFPLDADKVQFTRALYPYPLRAVYKGRGDPNDAANFIATDH